MLRMNSSEHRIPTSMTNPFTNPLTQRSLSNTGACNDSLLNDKTASHKLTMALTLAVGGRVQWCTGQSDHRRIG